MFKRMFVAASVSTLALLPIASGAEAATSTDPSVIVKAQRAKAPKPPVKGIDWDVPTKGIDWDAPSKGIDWDAPSKAPGDGGTVSTQRIDWD
ncbi:MAG: hypothetical protein JWQ91_660 [Aeromicrobium sp.]|uniref:hypothetical protein n=1 Tax=Aeromicrobium sp. TaxID=1871063 RepID=UPI0026288EDA|nr:hypothetical protein [Aeromicrobium sp.]MCW2823743.1 hypothetical protein [Aeromicrobium sp.]